MLKAKVVDTETESRIGLYKTGPNAGQSYERKKQINVFVEINGELRRLHLDIPQNGAPYPPGMYQIDELKMLSINAFYQFEIRPFTSPVLVPLVSESKPLFAAAK